MDMSPGALATCWKFRGRGPDGQSGTQMIGGELRRLRYRRCERTIRTRLGAYKPLVFLVKCMAPFYSTSMTDLCARGYCGTICAASENALNSRTAHQDCMKLQAIAQCQGSRHP